LSNQEQAVILGCKVDMLTSGQCLARIAAWVDSQTPAQVITLNAEIVFQAQTNPELLQIINQAQLVTPDGIGIVWGGKQLGYPIAERVSGIDLLESICQAAPAGRWGIYLLGAAPGVASEAALQLQRRFPGLLICGTQHGYFQDADVADIIEDINRSRADILIVSLGAPKQEQWISRYQGEISVPVRIGAGGSLDVIAGHKKRAPGWMIRLNLEWLYRLLAEPSRWRRQMVLPKFVWLILVNKYKVAARSR